MRSTGRVQRAQLPAPHLQAGDPGELTRNADLEGVGFEQVAVPHLDLTRSLVTSARFTRLSADEADLAGARWSEVELDQVNLPVVRAARSQWQDVTVRGRLGALEAYEAQWRSVHLAGCKVDYINLRSADLLDLVIEDCVIEELDLVEVTARRVELVDVRVGHLDLQHAQLRDVDLRGLTLASIQGIAGLRGATVTSAQLQLLAPLLAAEVGLSVED